MVSVARSQSLPALNKPLPFDPAVTTGKLSNGLTYYIRQNHKPEDRAEFRLIVKVGSVLEDDSQRGLAHFIEHMAFNGTKNFRKQELVNFLESIGMRFGADLNAYTSFDETVYQLQVPTDSTSVLEKSLQILEDWAHNVSFEDEEIDKERGVVIEEWRGGRGAESRIRDKQFPIIFNNSRYAERLPIGLKEVLDTFQHETLRRFYRDWYRPELMAVVAVGDFDKSKIEKLIREKFSRIPAVKKPRIREQFTVPEHKQPLFAIATDPEATRAGVTVYYKRPAQSKVTGNDYRRTLVNQIYTSMLSQRLYELTQQTDPPFQFGYASSSSLVPTTDAYVLGAAVDDQKILTGLEALLTEAARARQHGFTQSELDRIKVEFMRSYEQAFDERGKTESYSYAQEYARNFLEGEPAPGIAVEYELVKNVLPGITLEEINGLSNQLMPLSNRVIAVTAPAKEGIAVPDERQLRAVFEAVENKSVTAYQDQVSTEPLMAQTPQPGSIASTATNAKLGTTEWKLSNGVHVILKPTDFKDDEVMFAAFSPGGTSLVSDADFITATAATSVVTEGGLGNFDQIQLPKVLAGKVAGVSPYISELYEGLSGGGSPKDMETLFQLIYLYMTSPRLDSTAFVSYRTRSKSSLHNRSSSPESAFGDTLKGTLSQYHYRRRPWTEATFDSIDFHRAFDIYRERFADADDFTFIFVGNFKEGQIRPLVEKYLASLPTLPRTDQWRDIGVTPPKGVIAKSVRRGTEPKARVQMIFTGPFEWNRENRVAMGAMTDVLEIMLRESLREEKGGVYSVGVYGSPSKYPRTEYSLIVSFGCAPERVEELTQTVFSQIDSLKTFGPSATNLAKVKESDRRDREVGVKENQFWMAQLQYYRMHGEDPDNILTTGSLFEHLTAADVQDAARRYLNEGNYVKMLLLPEAQ
jgi:zinc protease